MSVTDAGSIEGAAHISAWLTSLLDPARSRAGKAQRYRDASAPISSRSEVVGSCAAQGAGSAATGSRRCPSSQPEALSIEQQLEAERARASQFERVASHFVSPQVLERLMADPDGLSLGGETRDVTVLFADVRGFTAISALLKRQPRLLAEVINGILSPLTEIVLAHGGTIDKYMGDCVMAFWGAPVDDPRHAANALRAAQAMLAAMPAINRELAEAFPDLKLPTIEIGVGVNSGDCIVGNVGSRRRFDYSVLGDPVNVASRLQTLCKAYALPLLVGHETARRAAREIDLIEIDHAVICGHDEPQSIYSI